MRFLGSSALLSLCGVEPSFSKAGGTPLAINTPEERAEYTKRLLKELCTDLGPRPTGSKACITGGKIIKREMERSLPQVELDWFTFTKWELVGKPEFSLGPQPIETWPSYGGPGTPPAGIRGVLKKTGEKSFAVADPSTGQTVANISINSYGLAVPHYQDTEKSALPTFWIGKQDIPLFERAERLKLPVFAKSSSRLRQNTRSCSVIGRLPGKVSDEMFIVAHSDTEYSSPGANDNTASVIVMIMLAHAAAAMKPDWTLTFMAADSEEYGGFLGAKHYAARREADGTIKNIKIALNFDSLTYGPNLQVYGKDEALKQVVKDIHRDLAIDTKPEYFDTMDFVMDSEPFRPSGAKALYFNSRGYNEKTLPVYHRPEDVPMAVPLDCVETSFLVLREFIRRTTKA
jgi:hypothetical protein